VKFVSCGQSEQCRSNSDIITRMLIQHNALGQFNQLEALQKLMQSAHTHTHTHTDRQTDPNYRVLAVTDSQGDKSVDMNRAPPPHTYHDHIAFAGQKATIETMAFAGWAAGKGGRLSAETWPAADTLGRG